ncbi:MAG: hypothetical protein AB1796_13965 [Bacillota bacterium]
MQQASEDGLTLLEVVFSMTLLGIVLLSFTSLFSCGFAASVQAGRTSQAAALAQEKMEELRACSYAELLAMGAELNGGTFPCPSEVSSIPVVQAGFAEFKRYHTLACETLEFDGYIVRGLRLEVVILQGVDREVARFISFVRKD